MGNGDGLGGSDGNTMGDKNVEDKTKSYIFVASDTAEAAVLASIR